MRWEVITDPHPELVNYKETGDNRQWGHGLCALGPNYIQLHSFTHKLQVSPVWGGGAESLAFCGPVNPLTVSRAHLT